jgi:hypothetical protein
MSEKRLNAEAERLESANRREKDWKLWGCYVSERAWGTVREDYSPDGAAWDYFPFEHSHLRAYRWNEDAIAGICDRKQNICFGLTFWNEKDPILKERLFGLSGPEGNHGEDVKEYYYYLDNTPTHSYMKFLYKYPQMAFPYELLKAENRRRNKLFPEFELIDTGIFNEDKYFDIFIEYAKADFDDICIRITAVNRADKSAPLHVLPTVWFRNDWTWFEKDKKPVLQLVPTEAENLSALQIKKNTDIYRLLCEGSSQMLFCENETNFEKLYGGKNKSGYAKDGINDYVVNKNLAAVNPQQIGTKAAAHYVLMIPAKGQETVYLRLSSQQSADKQGFSSHDDFIAQCEEVFQKRQTEADEFYRGIISRNALGKTVLSLYRQRLARRRPCFPAAARTTKKRT